MQTTEIREKLHQYVDTGEEKLLKLMLALAKEYTDEDDVEYDFTAEDVEVLDKYRAKRLNGDNKTYNWDDAKDIITGKRKSPFT